MITAFVLDGRGGGREIGWDEVRAWRPSDGLLWVHLDYSQFEVKAWVRSDDSGLDPVVAESLLFDDVRPRSLVTKDGLMLVMRGVNLNPGSNPEDMVAVRMWIDHQRVITLRRRRLFSLDDLRDAIARGVGPVSPGSFLVDLADHLVARVVNVVNDIEDAVDGLDQQVATRESHELRPLLADVRREAILLRRYLAPQRDAMSRLYNEPVEWLDDSQRMRLREVADRTMRCVEDLDAVRDRAGVTQEELASRLAEQLNSRMYVLSIVAALFLPLGFVTGLLGVNVAGIPGEDFPGGFVVLCVLLALLTLLQLWYFKRRGWL